MDSNYHVKRDVSDDLIGEAVIVLLKSGGPITISALLEQLNAMANTAENEYKKLACVQSIHEVKLCISKNFSQRSQFLEQQTKQVKMDICLSSRTHDTKH